MSGPRLGRPTITIGLLLLSAVFTAASLWAASPGLASTPAKRSAPPIDVRPSISVRSGNWIPLPRDEMRRAAGDAALARLSDAGRIRLRDDEGRPPSSRLALEIGLIGPAETAKLTITLDVPGSPTLVSTASISVRGLDHAGIFAALQHVGDQAAERLVAKLDLIEGRTPEALPTPEALTAPDAIDPARREIFDRAQAEKHAGEYATARRSFESVIAGAPADSDPLARMAHDELRYGLPVYEARQSLNELGRLSLPGQQAARDAALSRAEHLYRQIQAENPQSVERVSEAQRALDELSVVRGALANAMRAQLLSRAAGVRVALLQHMMMEGRCPDLEQARRVAGHATGRGLDLVDAVPSPGGGGAWRYRLAEADSGSTIELLCDETGVQVVDPDRR